MDLSVGQYSDKGNKPVQQDCFGYLIPSEPQLSLKGAAFVIADGISTSSVSQVASETSVKSFLDDYFCTSDAWSVKHSANRVLQATNAWLYSQTQQSPYRYDKDKGFVCTLSALIFKASIAHLFHVGDSRIYQRRGDALEQLTHDHRLWVSQQQNYLSRALGADAHLEIDYSQVNIKPDDLFILATDGVYDFVDAETLLTIIDQYADDLDTAAKGIIDKALKNGSNDNLTIQIIRINQLAKPETLLLQKQVEELPLPPILEARSELDGYTIIREIHATSRSHVYIAVDQQTENQVILKTPSIDLSDDPAYLERFLMEEWIARRVNSAHVIQSPPSQRTRNFLYTVTEYINGQTLQQWLTDNPQPSLEDVRNIIEQVAKGLIALHRSEILHQDIKPDNIMIDDTGTVKIIDFGSATVAGVNEAAIGLHHHNILGTALYTAPEYFLGEAGTSQSDIFSLGVLAYHLLSGRYPYGTDVAKCRTVAAQRKLSYRSVLNEERAIPSWINETLRKAVQPSPSKRYLELSEFIYDLRHPNPDFINRQQPPLMDRNPVAFWQSVSAILALTVIYLLSR